MSWFSKAVKKVKKEVKRTGRKIEKEVGRAKTNPLVRYGVGFIPGGSAALGVVDAFSNYSGSKPSRRDIGTNRSTGLMSSDGLNASELRNLSEFREFNARKAAEKDSIFRSFNNNVVDRVAKSNVTFATKLRSSDEALNNFADSQNTLYQGNFQHGKENQSAAAKIGSDDSVKSGE